MCVCVCVTLGRGQRNWATGRSATKGTVRRLGNTKNEAIASMITESDITLIQRKCQKKVSLKYGGRSKNI